MRNFLIIAVVSLLFFSLTASAQFIPDEAETVTIQQGCYPPPPTVIWTGGPVVSRDTFIKLFLDYSQALDLIKQMAEIGEGRGDFEIRFQIEKRLEELAPTEIFGEDEYNRAIKLEEIVRALEILLFLE